MFRIRITWQCAHCGKTHHWRWDAFDFPAIGGLITMICDGRSGCDQKTPCVYEGNGRFRRV